MPAETFSKPLENMLNDKCSYEYYSHSTGTYSKTQKTRICHVILDTEDKYNQNVVLMVFTIRNQSGKWKIHSEGIRRTDPGATVPLRNKAIALAKENSWKYAAIAVAGEDTPDTETVAKYVVSMESYAYGNETVYDLTNELATLQELGMPDFYRCEVEANGNSYSFAFVKKENLVNYLSVIDNRTYRDANDILVITDPVSKDLTIEDLGAILRKMYDDAIGGKVSAIHMFGLKYAEVIKENNFATSEIIRLAGISESYNVEVSKGISIYKVIKDNEYGIRFYKGDEDAFFAGLQATSFDFKTLCGKGINKIFFGTPGCGKSYHIEHDILGKTAEGYTGDYAKENIIRTTFYQDYSNTDFVGQILPKITKGQDGEPDKVEYIFNPGPFTLALIQAISNPTEKVALVVEEINRGNAPAIFGDIFQLLDRDENSISEYGIVNVSLMDYLNDYTFTVAGQKKRYTFSEIKIPGNMDIFATMNTSDQNVYTLDTAFIRRWEREKTKNSFLKCGFKGKKVPGMDYTWQEFIEAINACIASHLEDLQVNEDKQIGAFFVKESLLDEDAETFAFKVFDYLWNDVAKLDREIFFNHYDTLENLIDAYKTIGVNVFKPGIFRPKSRTTE